uniref:Uncharacterized protein n=1 Tax=Anguilla anguilla TaxID=7936 RepID=A0A0E9TMJ6_ANGAN
MAVLPFQHTKKYYITIAGMKFLSIYILYYIIVTYKNIFSVFLQLYCKH